MTFDKSKNPLSYDLLLRGSDRTREDYPKLKEKNKDNLCQFVAKNIAIKDLGQKGERPSEEVLESRTGVLKQSVRRVLDKMVKGDLTISEIITFNGHLLHADKKIVMQDWDVFFIVLKTNEWLEKFDRAVKVEKAAVTCLDDYECSAGDSFIIEDYEITMICILNKLYIVKGTASELAKFLSEKKIEGIFKNILGENYEEDEFYVDFAQSCNPENILDQLKEFFKTEKSDLEGNAELNIEGGVFKTLKEVQEYYKEYTPKEKKKLKIFESKQEEDKITKEQLATIESKCFELLSTSKNFLAMLRNEISKKIALLTVPKFETRIKGKNEINVQHPLYPTKRVKKLMFSALNRDFILKVLYSSSQKFIDLKFVYPKKNSLYAQKSVTTFFLLKTIARFTKDKKVIVSFLKNLSQKISQKFSRFFEKILVQNEISRASLYLQDKFVKEYLPEICKPFAHMHDPNKQI